jgi:hypothetical protein
MSGKINVLLGSAPCLERTVHYEAVRMLLFSTWDCRTVRSHSQFPVTLLRTGSYLRRTAGCSPPPPPQASPWGDISTPRSRFTNLQSVCLSVCPLSDQTGNTYTLGKCSFLGQGELTAWSSALQKLTVTQLVKKLPTFYGTRIFIAMFTRARHWSLSRTRWMQSTPPPPPHFPKVHSNIIFPSEWSLCSGFPTKIVEVHEWGQVAWVPSAAWCTQLLLLQHVKWTSL